MILHFATCDRPMAERYFKHEKFAYLSKEAKAFVLDHLAEQSDEDLTTGFRVCDPAYHAARVMTADGDLAAALQGLQSDLSTETH